MTNGVRQGGVLSHMLFNVYINDLSIRLSQTGTGDSIGGKFVNHMIYADDLCVIYFPSSGLQSLLNICTDYCQCLMYLEECYPLMNCYVNLYNYGIAGIIEKSTNSIIHACLSSSVLLYSPICK